MFYLFAYKDNKHFLQINWKDRVSYTTRKDQLQAATCLYAVKRVQKSESLRFTKNNKYYSTVYWRIFSFTCISTVWETPKGKYSIVYSILSIYSSPQISCIFIHLGSPSPWWLLQDLIQKSNIVIKNAEFDADLESAENIGKKTLAKKAIKVILHFFNGSQLSIEFRVLCRI